jgi:hypothetical protein
MAIEPGNYDKELIKRTLNLIDSYKGKYTSTLLMNALLSLIVLPAEFNKRHKLKYFNQGIHSLTELEFIFSSPDFIFDPQSGKNNLQNLLRRIRNGIAHQRIETLSENGKWSGIIIQDLDNAGNVGLNVRLSINELKAFARFIAMKYLDETKSLAS